MLKAGFIGFGRMGITHFSILNTHPMVEVTAIADTSKTMRNLLERYLQVKTYADYRQMIEDNSLDFIVVSTPTDSHAEIIEFALDRNLHVFTEKPLAMAPEEGEKIIAKLEKSHLVNQVGYVNRFNEVFMEVKKLLDRGAIGELKSFASEMYGATVIKGSNSSWRSKQKLGGGCMYEFASHCIDLAVYFLGPPERVSGSVLKSVYSSSVEDVVTSTLIYGNGVCGTIAVNWSDASYRKPANIITFWGTKGKIIADKHAFKIYLMEDQELEGFHKGWNTRYITDFAKSVRVYLRGNEFTRQLDSFVNAIINGESENQSGFLQAYYTDVLIDEIRRDAESTFTEQSGERVTGAAATGAIREFTLWEKLLRRLGLHNA
jgi:predicted dehydrogenase